jgi:acetate kinase
MPRCLLVLNAGSSSLKFALFQAGAGLRRLAAGDVGRIGRGRAELAVTSAAQPQAARRRSVSASDHTRALALVLKEILPLAGKDGLAAIGHRIVHGGGRYTSPQRVTAAMLENLRRFRAFDPEHLPAETGLIATLRARFPGLPQVACFDTAFHRDLPRVAQLLPLPRRFEKKGVRRYGFHGLSYAYLLEELGRIDPAAAKGRVILAHLGNGASLAAVHRGRSVDTSMGLTPAAGLVMGTRTGDVDPGIFSFLARTGKMTAARFDRMVNHESGLLGISGTSADMRDLLAREPRDARAAEAVALFCYQAKKWIGAYAAALGGLDTLVFAGGIGENAPAVRERICAGLGFLGVALDRRRNARNAPLISPDAGRVRVRVIRTDEELMIARSVRRMLENLSG